MIDGSVCLNVSHRNGTSNVDVHLPQLALQEPPTIAARASAMRHRLCNIQVAQSEPEIGFFRNGNVSAFMANRDEVLAARSRVERAISPAKVIDFETIPGGHSGTRLFKVTTQDQRLCAKVVLSWKDIGLPGEISSEYKGALWAASRGFGPSVIFSDIHQGVLLTEYLENEMGEWNQGAQEPRLFATVKLMRALHQVETPAEPAHYDPEEASTCWKTEFSRLSEEKRRSSFMQLADQVALTCIQRLSRQTYRSVTCHGDFNIGNIIYNGGKAWLIDWGCLHFGDGMKDVAYFGIFANFGMDQLDAMLNLYDSELAHEDRDRAKHHLGLFRVHWYLQIVRGMCWKTPEWHERTLRTLESLLIEDGKWLKIEDVSRFRADCLLLVLNACSRPLARLLGSRHA